MSPFRSKLILVVALAFVTALGGAAYLAANPATPSSNGALAPSGTSSPLAGGAVVATSSTQPKVSWSVPQVTQSGFPGTTSTITIAFESDQSLNSGVLVKLTPSLAGKVLPTPSHFATISANQWYTVSLTFIVPNDFTQRNYNGTLQLIAQEESNQTYSPPLPVSVEADWNTVSPDGLFTINLPLDFVLTDISIPNEYSTNVFEIQLSNQDKVGYIWVYTTQQWTAAQQAEEYPLFLTQAKGLVYAFGISQALPVSDQSVRNEFLTAIRTLRPQ